MKVPDDRDPRWIQLLMKPEGPKIKSLPIRIAIERARRAYQQSQSEKTLLLVIGQVKDFLARNEQLLGPEIEDLFNF